MYVFAQKCRIQGMLKGARKNSENDQEKVNM